MKKVFSKRWRLNAWDLSKALALFFITNFLDLVWQAAQIWLSDKKEIQWQEMAIVSVIATLGYLKKNFMTKVPQQAVEHAAKEAGITNIK